MNELLLGAEALLSALFVLGAWRYARDRLYTVIIILLILIASVGGKLVEFFGHVTNTGNIFYAAVFLATYFLIERMGKREGIYSIWVGVIGVASFFVFIQITVALVGFPPTAEFNAVLASAFAPFSQVTAASLIAYVLSQNLNVYLYVYLKQKMRGTRIWLRANICNLIAQMLDSVVFFTIAFWGVVPPENITDIIMTGFVVKVAFIAVSAPLLYLNRVEQDDEKGMAMIAVR